VGFLDDPGGTKTKVTFQGKEQTLHELWDSGMLNTERGSARQMAQRLDEELSEDDRKAWKTGRVKEWADESIAMATKYVYPLPESREISAEYANRGLPAPVAEKRRIFL
jgi:S1/P1 Nuclease